MMRYQRLSPDCHPLGNGRKPTLRACSEDDADSSARISNYSASFGANPLRARSASGSEAAVLSDAPSTSASAAAPRVHNDINGACSVAGTVLLSGWGNKKRSRGSREGRPAADESQGTRSRKLMKIQRRNAAAAGGGGEKLAAASAMPPPGAGYTRGANLRPCTPVRDSLAPLHIRTVEERSSGQHRLEKRSPPSPPEKSNSTADASLSAAVEVVKPKSDQEKAVNGCEKKNTEPFEWPRIYLSLSRKEKEDDFLAMKGTKLPQRPKKRAKNVDKTLQYCFPGMWLSDLTRGRYEVREKKCVKKVSVLAAMKLGHERDRDPSSEMLPRYSLRDQFSYWLKRRGLKGMESMDSESE